MGSPQNPVWAELVQLVPVVSLALPFILSGKVELGQAGSGFVVGALLTLPATLLVLKRGHHLNPIALGTALWLWVGALAFAFALEPLRTGLAETQALGLFVGVFAVGLVATLTSPSGFLGCRDVEKRWMRRASLSLLALGALSIAWAWLFRHDVRLGGGLPFVTLNVVRRVLILAAAKFSSRT